MHKDIVKRLSFLTLAKADQVCYNFHVLWDGMDLSPISAAEPRPYSVIGAGGVDD